MQPHWKPTLTTVLLVGGGLALGGVFFLFQQQVNTLSTRVQELEKQLPSPPVNQAELNQVREDLKQSLVASKNQFKSQLEQDQQAILKQVNELQELKITLTKLVQKNLDSHLLLKTQFENSQQNLEQLLETLKRQAAVTNVTIPPGVVMGYTGPLTPAVQQQLFKMGWLLCDGRELPVDQYAALYQAIQTTYGGQAPKTFKLPDFRGVFLRGLDLDKQLDPQRGLGSYQEDTNKAHVHEANLTGDGLHEHRGTTDEMGKHRHRLEAQGYWFTSKLQNERAAMTNAVNDNQEYWTTMEGQHSHTVEIVNSGGHTHTLTMSAGGGAEEARPKNYAVVYLIKF